MDKQNFHDKFESRSVMRRVAHQLPDLVIQENMKLNQKITQLETDVQELRRTVSELLDVYLNDQGYLPEVEQKARAILARTKD